MKENRPWNKMVEKEKLLETHMQAKLQGIWVPLAYASNNGENSALLFSLPHFSGTPYYVSSFPIYISVSNGLVMMGPYFIKCLITFSEL